MLFCPENGFLDVMMTNNIGKRIHAIFGKDHNLTHIQTFKEIFAERIRAERGRLSGLESLKCFIATRANSFLITEPRSIAVGEPKQELMELFAEIFGKTTNQEEKKRVSAKEQLYQTLTRRLGPTKLDDHVLKNLPDIKVPVHGFNKTVKPCAGFLNGSFNLVVERQLTPTNSFERMSCDMIIGQRVYEKEDERWGKQRLISLADPNENTKVKEQIDAFRPVMQKHNTDICTVHEMATRIHREARSLSKSNLRL